MTILFDGVCNLCNRLVLFIIKRDKKRLFKFASLQSIYGEDVSKKLQIKSPPYGSIILIDKEKIYFKSEAVLKILIALGGVWRIASLLKIIPKSIRDYCYSIISRHRYKIFGKRESCMIPSEALKNRFLN